MRMIRDKNFNCPANLQNITQHIEKFSYQKEVKINQIIIDIYKDLDKVKFLNII